MVSTATVSSHSHSIASSPAPTASETIVAVSLRAILIVILVSVVAAAVVVLEFIIPLLGALIRPPQVIGLFHWWASFAGKFGLFVENIRSRTH